MNKYLNISQIESWLHGKLKGTVSSHVFAGNMPDVPDSQWSDMVEIDVAQVKDTSEYNRGFGEALVNLFIYVKPNSTGKKNVSRFNQIEDSLATIIESDRDPHYTMSEMYSEQGYDSSYKYHYKIIALRIIIN